MLCGCLHSYIPFILFFLLNSRCRSSCHNGITRSDMCPSRHGFPEHTVTVQAISPAEIFMYRSWRPQISTVCSWTPNPGRSVCLHTSALSFSTVGALWLGRNKNAFRTHRWCARVRSVPSHRAFYSRINSTLPISFVSAPPPPFFFHLIFIAKLDLRQIVFAFHWKLKDFSIAVATVWYCICLVNVCRLIW